MTMEGAYHMIHAIHIPDDEEFSVPKEKNIRRRNPDRLHDLKRKYGLLLIGAFALAAWTILTCCVTGTIAHHNAWQEANEVLKAEYDEKVKGYEQEQADATQAAYWKSGDASLESQINTEADLLSRVDIWKTDDAYLTFVCNVWVRVMRGDYPGSVEEVLKQAKQYDFFDENKPIDVRRRDITRKLLWDLHKNVFPANLTMDYAWLEMQKDGAVCVLHSKDKYYVNGDITWRYQG